MILPSTQMTSSGQTSLPHCCAKLATDCGARKSKTLMPRLDGFHRCRPPRRSAYLDEIDSRLHITNGHTNVERMRMPTLMPVMYALARCGQRPVTQRPRMISRAMAETMEINVSHGPFPKTGCKTLS